MENETQRALLAPFKIINTLGATLAYGVQFISGRSVAEWIDGEVIAFYQDISAWAEASQFKVIWLC